MSNTSSFQDVCEGHICADQRHTILVVLYLFGQFRIQLTDADKYDPAAPSGHGAIVRELCTYSEETMKKVVAEIKSAKDPVAQAQTYERVYNCEWPGRGRIRLDNKPAPRRFHRDSQSCPCEMCNK